MREMHRCVLHAGLIAVCSGLVSPFVRADGLYSVTDLGPSSPSVNAAGGNQSSSSSTYPYLSGQDLIPSNGNYLPALTAAQQASFQSGSFDLYAHPATTSLDGEAYYPSQFGGGYDIVNTGMSNDQINGFTMTTSNNLGVTVGTASEITTAGIANRLVEFTPDPHTVNQQISGNTFQQVQSPGYVNVVWTKAEEAATQFWGMATGINDHNNIAFTEYKYTYSSATGNVTILVPHLLVGGVDTVLGSLGGANGAAYALNNSNEVVGWSQIANGTPHAFLYNNGTMEDLNLVIPPLSGITLTSAVGINAAGEIVAYGTDASGQSHEYLLTPAEVPVPEPSSMAVMSLLVAGAAARRVRIRSGKR